MRIPSLLLPLWSLGLLALAPADAQPRGLATSTPATQPGPERPAPDPVLIGAGDIAVCGEPGAARVADRIGQLLERDPQAVLFTAGDNSNEDGSGKQFERCFAPTWGRFKDRIRPSPGNHDYKMDDASGYFDYFGDAAGARGQGYYSFDLGAWHIVALNSNCKKLGGCERGSTQEQWLRDDLKRNNKACTLAFFHHPLFSSGGHGQAGMGSKDELIRQDIRPLVNALHESGAEVIVNGHDHVYERFAPQTPLGQPNLHGGMRHFVVGTGGASVRSVADTQAANSEVRIGKRFGVIRFVLKRAGYTWQFVAADDGSLLDAGSGVCH